MPIVRQANPWLEAAGQTNNLADTLVRIMVTLPQLKNQAAQQQWNQRLQEGQLSNETALVQPRVDLLGAQTSAAKAQGEFDTQRTAASKAGQSAAEDAGLAEFGRTMLERVPGYNPLQTSYMDNSPENLAALMDAQRRMGLMRNAASSPTAAASMFRPSDIQHNAVNPLGDVTQMAQTPDPIKLGAGQRLVDPNDFSTLVEAMAPNTANRPMSVAPGNSVVDPQTGKVLFTAPNSTGRGEFTGPALAGMVSGMGFPALEETDPQLAGILRALTMSMAKSQLGTNTPQPTAGSATNRFKIKQVN